MLRLKAHLLTIYFCLVIIGATCFVVSLFSPLLSVNKLYIFTDTITLISMLSDLLKSKEWFLFSIILLFTIILPAMKFLVLFLYGISSADSSIHKTSMKFLESVSKWAMLDVFLVAIVITIVKLDLFTTGVTHYGLYLFVSSILLSMVCVQLQKLLVDRS